MNLMPLKLNKSALRENIEELNKYHVNDCIECEAVLMSVRLKYI